MAPAQTTVSSAGAQQANLAKHHINHTLPETKKNKTTRLIRIKGFSVRAKYRLPATAEQEVGEMEEGKKIRERESSSLDTAEPRQQATKLLPGHTRAVWIRQRKSRRNRTGVE